MGFEVTFNDSTPSVVVQSIIVATGLPRSDTTYAILGGGVGGGGTFPAGGGVVAMSNINTITPVGMV